MLEPWPKTLWPGADEKVLKVERGLEAWSELLAKGVRPWRHKNRIPSPYTGQEALPMLLEVMLKGPTVGCSIYSSGIG